MIAFWFLIWTIARSKDIDINSRRNSRRDSVIRDTRDRADSRDVTTVIGLPTVDRRKSRLRRHSRRFYVDRAKSTKIEVACARGYGTSSKAFKADIRLEIDVAAYAVWASYVNQDD
ncbi:hypothetical protein V1477_009449 [Vespula maculifrons]|uniref:Uncharacterized protein n=3 Tax=Vespula TaxID=7451 RepID=A0A834U990_VESPE|nr:hypothetical protein HZH66_007123 [Vespula vulgaris]KAF7423245.1 hypothetical protein H0235_008528 [Vespula pensylvanica]